MILDTECLSSGSPDLFCSCYATVILIMGDSGFISLSPESVFLEAQGSAEVLPVRQIVDQFAPDLHEVHCDKARKKCFIAYSVLAVLLLPLLRTHITGAIKHHAGFSFGVIYLFSLYEEVDDRGKADGKRHGK